MYNLIIAEDEPIVREGIAKRVDFNSLGFELAAVCENGKEAYNAIEAYKPTVVITDICMPIMDGLELARLINKNYPDIKTVLLTGYSEFEYAQKAVQYKVYEYVLKPISAKLLRELLEKIKNQLDAENEERLKRNKLETNLYISKGIVTEHYLNSLICEKKNRADVYKKFDEFGISFEASSPLAIIVYPDDMEEALKNSGMTYEMINYGIYNICYDICGSDGIVFKNDTQKTVIILKNIKNMKKIIEQIQEAVKAVFKTTVSLFIGKQVDGIEDIYKSYEEACIAKGYRKMIDRGSVINANDISQNKNVLDFHRKNYSSLILEHVIQGDREKARKCVDDMFMSIKRNFVSYPVINVYIKNMTIEIIRKIRDVTMSDFEVDDIISDIDENKDISDINKELNTFVEKCIDYLNSQKGGYAKQLVQRAINYIKDNYSDPDISLKSMCSYLSVSSSYFSAQFKAFTGVTFVEYLTSIRIEKARNLLKTTNLRSYEIAEKTGYLDPHYFSVIFKKHTGKSPKEFKEHEKIH